MLLRPAGGSCWAWMRPKTKDPDNVLPRCAPPAAVTLGVKVYKECNMTVHSKYSVRDSGSAASSRPVAPRAVVDRREAVLFEGGSESASRPYSRRGSAVQG
jgi:hypothetical protein